ncbi:iron-regulated protein [Myxococcota bacterium]|nr:iron-regulated protein [Myxococcota bacterium]
MRTPLPLLALLLDLAACTKGGEEGLVWPDATADAVSAYTSLVELSYADSLVEAEALELAVGAFVSAPSDGTLDAARGAWLQSREPYLQTEVFRFYDGPIDNPEDGPEGLLNAWPLDERYLDYVEGDAETGIVNDLSVTLDADTLISLNEAGGEKNIATGYHAVEFLLWGQDHSDDGPGERPYTDYVVGEGGTAQNQDRRAEALTLVSGLIVEHLGQVHDAWAPGAAYRVGFEADPEASFAKILTGMIVLSGFETGGERLQASLDSGDQEDEHSCFSDNTHRDMVQDVRGVLNVWEGRYTRLDGSVVSGVSVKEIVEEVAPELADALDAQIRESLQLAEALQAPYDQEIAPGNAEGNARVQALVVSLRAQEALLFEVFTAFELTVEIPE